MTKPAAEDTPCKAVFPDLSCIPAHSFLKKQYVKEVFDWNRSDVSEKWDTAVNLKPGGCSGFCHERVEERFTQL